MPELQPFDLEPIADTGFQANRLAFEELIRRQWQQAFETPPSTRSGAAQAIYEYGAGMSISEKPKAKKPKKMPTIVVQLTEENGSDGVTYYIASITRNGEVIDRYVDRDKDSAMRMLEDMKQGQMRQHTMTRVEYSETPTTDIRGERIAHELSRATRNNRRIDRRARRPEDDVIREDGLVLDIPPDDVVEAEPEAPVARRPIRRTILRPGSRIVMSRGSAA